MRPLVVEIASTSAVPRILAPRILAPRAVLSLAAVLLSLTLLAPMAAAQTASPSPDKASDQQSAPAGQGVSGDALPAMKPETAENPFSRLEIVSFGSFPIMLFYTGFAFDLERFVANGFDSNYAPWPFQSSYSAPLSDSDRYVRLGVALGASLVVGGIDALLHAAKIKKAKRLREALVAPPADPAQPNP